MKPVRSIRSLLVVGGVLLFAAPTAGQPLAATDRRQAPGRTGELEPASPAGGEQPAPPQRHTAGSVAGAPTSDRASGVAQAEREPAERGRSVGRALLFLPRIAFAAVNAPVRGAYWLSERYRVPTRVRQALFNDEGTAGLVPTGSAETDRGLGVGARFVHRDLVGRGEHLALEAAYGGATEPGAAARIDTGDRLGDRLFARLDGGAQARPRDLFFGIGNADQEGSTGVPVDPYADPVAVESRFHQRMASLTAMGELGIAGPLATRASSTALWRRVDGGDIADSYLTDALPGFGEARSSTYSQLELRLDTRERPARSEPPGPRATGVALSAFAGYATGDSFQRYGGEAVAQVPIVTRQRIVVLRALAEGVAGPLDQIPFVDLPRLGGAALLRGYPADRFRDRAMALASAEYRFDLSDSLGAFLFADGGRVLPDLSELAEGGLRAGYGGGLDLRSGEQHLGRLSLASSIDGGLFVSALFDPFGDGGERR